LPGKSIARYIYYAGNKQRFTIEAVMFQLPLPEGGSMINNGTTISYGKLKVPVYRVYAHPLSEIAHIPESQFTGRANILFALEVDVEVFGNNFLPAYTQGDNSNVVATDSMKNFVLRQALDFEGATVEDFLHILGRRFLQTYAQMELIRLTARELPFNNLLVPQRDGATFQPSAVLFSRSHGDFTFATLEFARDNTLPIVTDHQCGRLSLELLKVTGSAFTRFVHDEYTTLPERIDRPLFIYLDAHWKYKDITDLLASDHARYVPAEQVRDVIQVVFHEFVSESIQHLVYEMGRRLLTRFPQLAQVSFSAQNRTRDQIAVSDSDEKIKVYSDPFSAYGIIKLTMNSSETQ
jgi:urate oxidase